jgi:hypothetical protein
MNNNDKKEVNTMNELFAVTSISREDLLHPIIGLTVSEASMVSDEQMEMIAAKLAGIHSNQILKNSIKLVAEVVLNKKL